MSKKIFRGHADQCARCGNSPAYATNLINPETGPCYFLCLDCRDEAGEFMETDPVFREFEYIHEPYVMIKRRGVTTEEALGLVDNDAFRKVIDRIFEIRKRLRVRIKGWVQGEPH